jgi:hypothetical protein
VPIIILPLVVMIEIISFLSQPVSILCASSPTCWRDISLSGSSVGLS